jgi:hypothetical protein
MVSSDEFRRHDLELVPCRSTIFAYRVPGHGADIQL